MNIKKISSHKPPTIIFIKKKSKFNKKSRLEKFIYILFKDKILLNIKIIFQYYKFSFVEQRFSQISYKLRKFPLQYQFVKHLKMNPQSNKLITDKTFIFLEKENMQVCYDCECGKRYFNFPALYLHFQRKHKKKISTKIQQQSCHVTIKDNVKVITYLVNEKNNEKNKNGQQEHEAQIDFLFDKFIHFQSDKKQLNLAFDTELLRDFQKYVKKRCVSKQNIIIEIPFYFNGFILQNMTEQINTEKYCRAVRIFEMLSFWLHENGYSLYQVVHVGFPDINKEMIE